MLPDVLANALPFLSAVFIYVRLPALFILVIIGLLWIFTVKARGSIDMAKHRALPGPPPLPIIGNVMEFSGKYPNSMIEGSKSILFCYVNELDYAFVTIISSTRDGREIWASCWLFRRPLSQGAHCLQRRLQGHHGQSEV